MKIKQVIIALSFSSILFSCDWNQSQEKEQQSLMEISKQELAMALKERDQLLALVKEVSTSLEQIKRLDKTIKSAYPKGNADQKAQILADISSLKETIQKRKEQLQELESKLQNSTINNKELQETIGALRVQIDSQIEEIESIQNMLTVANRHIDMLNNTVDSLDTACSMVTGERNAIREALVQLENKLNTCYYVVATKSELKSCHIIASAFLGKTQLRNGDFNEGCFITGDKRILDTIPLNVPKAKILTNHPETSYELIDKDGQKIITITNPEQFWSLTNYLIVQKN